MSKPTKKTNVEREVDENLRRVYQRLVEQEVPPRFLEIIDSLRREELTKGKEPGSHE